MISFIRKRVLSIACILFCFHAVLVCAQEKAAGPLKVYILAGQSNMQGKAKAFTLAQMAMDAKTKPMLAKIQTPEGKHNVFKDVWMASLGSAREEMKGNLTVGYGGGDKIGPELTFGIYLQEYVKEPILIIKTAWGGKSLSVDFRPPSAGPLKAMPEKDREKCGHYYREMITYVKKVLSDVKAYYPNYDPKKGYEVEGFVWFQGCSDFGGLAYPNVGKPGGFDEYSRLLACLIRDVRKEVESPKMRTVVGVIGINGELDRDRYRQFDKPVHMEWLREFRRAMTLLPSTPEFKATVAAVHTEKFWEPQLEELQSRWSKIKAKSNELKKQKLSREEHKKQIDAYLKTVYNEKEWDLYSKSVSNAAYHYMGAAKIMGRIGKAFAEAMTAPSRAKTAIAAVASLKSHITGEKKLDDKEIDALRATIDANRDVLRYDEETIKAFQDLVLTYDKVNGPLWIKYSGLNGRKRNPGDAIHWATFWVMQHYFDAVHNSEGMRNHGALLEGYKFACSDRFPGKVEATVDPEAVHKVKVNGSHPKTWGGPVFHMDIPARRPTGTYLAPGTIATVTVPASILNKGYKIRVGAHSWDHSRKPRILRLFRVSALYDVDRTEIKVANPLGGGIYLEVPYKADGGVIEVSVKGAVRSPYFSWKPFHRTTMKQWREVERHHKAPWADFQSEQFMTQVPTNWIYKLDDPITPMVEWDKAIAMSNVAMGRTLQLGKETLYLQVDLQLRGRAFHPGYPAGNRGYDPAKDYGGYHNSHLVRGPKNVHSYVFHEQGHGYLFPKYVGDREAAVNYPHIAVMNRAFGKDLVEAFQLSRSQYNKFMTLENTAIAWMMSDHFIDGTGMLGYERQYQLKGHAKFVDIVRLFGWLAMDNFFKSLCQDHEDGKPWPRFVADTDRYTLRLCETAEADVRPIIHFWGIPTQDNAKSDAAIKEKGIKPSAKVYDLLVKYKGLVPKDNKTFREYALKWWGKEPSPKGYTTQRNHAARWQSYNEEAAAKAQKTVQSILDRYFPNGRPQAEKPK